MGRPARKQAEAAVRRFLDGEGIKFRRLHLYEDGDDGWAFWLHDDDTTSYVHADLYVEWYGTTDSEEKSND